MFSMFKKVQSAVHIYTDSEVDEPEQCCSWEDDAVLTLNVNDLFTYVPSVPGISWGRMADACINTVSPMYRAVQKTLQGDIEHLMQLMVDLEGRAIEDDCDVSVCETAAEESLPRLSEAESLQGESSSPRPVIRSNRFPRKRLTDPELDNALTIPSSDPSIPTIIITPCPSLPRDRSCLVPYQDVSYGNRLAVPTYPVVNEAFPPLLPKPAPFVERWRFKDGHWWAVLPTPEEQNTRGMFSRPMPRRRRVCVDAWSRHTRTRRIPTVKTAPSPSLAA